MRSKVAGYEGSGIVGEAEAACDPSGRFEVPTIAAGLLTLELAFDCEKGTTLRGDPPRGLVLAAGSTVEAAIPLRPTVRVRGVVREKGTKRPIAGVGLAINRRFGGDSTAVSDADGNYSAVVVREVNQAFGWPIRIPRPFYEPEGAPEVPQRMPTRDKPELLLPVLELARGRLARGRRGRGREAGGGCRGRGDLWPVDPDAGRSRGPVHPGGRRPAPGAEARRPARAGEHRTSAMTIRAGNLGPTPLKLTIRPGQTGRISGRVVDPSGRPIAGASVRIWRQVRHESGVMFLKEPVAGEDGSIVVRTGADGRFRAGRPLPVGDEYAVDASAPGRLSGHSAAVKLSSGDQTIPDVVLPGVRIVEGRVVDRSGRPVAGARVIQSGDGPLRTETRADGEGRFELPGIIEGPAFVFAAKAGYRFQAKAVDLGAGPVTVELSRDEEPPVVTYGPQASSLPAEEEKALARRLFLPYAERVLAKGTAADKYRLVADAVQVDPALVVERLEAMKFAEPDYLNLARVQLVERSRRRISTRPSPSRRSVPMPRPAPGVTWVSVKSCRGWRRTAPGSSRTRHS